MIKDQGDYLAIVFILIVMLSVVWGWIYDKIVTIKEWFVEVYDSTHDIFNFGVFPALPPQQNYQNFYKKTDKEIAKEKMDRLIRELIKALYCKEVLNNPPMTEEIYEKRLVSLRSIEEKYPDLVRNCSPTRTGNKYIEEMAVQAYSFKEWEMMKRTLSLTVEVDNA